MSEQEVVAALLGRTPTPVDDVAELASTARAHRDAMGSRSAYADCEAVIDCDDPILAEIASRPDIGAQYAGVDWRPALVDLRKVIAFQKEISLEGHAERTKGAMADDLRSLAEICVPKTQTSLPAAVITDGDGKGFIVSSVNPNLRIASSGVSEALVPRGGNLPPLRALALTMLVDMGSRYLVVANFRGRPLLRDGYHRATALLRLGIPIVPCIFIEAKSFKEVMPESAGFISQEILYGTHPPLLPDFWDDAVAGDVQRIEMRKVIRIRGDEFLVQR